MVQDHLINAQTITYSEVCSGLWLLGTWPVSVLVGPSAPAALPSAHTSRDRTKLAWAWPRRLSLSARRLHFSLPLRTSLFLSFCLLVYFLHLLICFPVSVCFSISLTIPILVFLFLSHTLYINTYIYLCVWMNIIIKSVTVSLHLILFLTLSFPLWLCVYKYTCFSLFLISKIFQINSVSAESISIYFLFKTTLSISYFI